MSLLSSGEIKRADRLVGGSMARILQVGSRLQKMNTDGSYQSGTSDAIAVIGDTGGVSAGNLVAASGYDTTTGYRKVKPADANSVALARDIYYAPSAIAAAATGYVYKQAMITGANTNAGTVGDPVYLSATAGAWTLTKPTGATTLVIEIGSILVKSATIGVINVDLEGAEKIVSHDHSDDANGGTLASIAGLTGTTEAAFTVDSDSSAARIGFDTNSATGNFLMKLVPGNLSGNTTITFPTGSDTVVTLAGSQILTNKTLTTPTIGSFVNAPHTHADPANGGTISIPAIAGTTNNTFEVDNDNATGTLQLKTTTGGADFAVILTNAITTGLAGDVTVSIPAATTTLVGTDVTQTLTGKTLTAPVINACTITGAVTITTPTVTGTWTNLGTVTTVNIDGGSIDGTAIGGATPAAGAFTTLSASDDVTIAAGKDIALSAGSGYIQINAATSGALKFLPTAATAQTVTLSTIAQTVGAATVSIPDMANTNANFVMTETAQTVNGAKTFGSGIVVPAITGSDASLGIDGTAGAGGGAGGIIAVAAGGGHTNGAGGAVTLAGGLGAGTGNGGLISVTGGQSGAGAAADGGAASVVGGAGAGTGASLGGDVAITGGAAADTGTGGDVTITSGASAGVGGTAGNVAIDVGTAAGGTPGSISIGGTTALTIGIGKAGATTTITGDLAIAAGDNITTTAGDGYLQLNGATTGGIKIAPIAGGTNLLTIANAATGQLSTVTIPDPGNATASFVLSKGTNTITGTLDISGATVTYRAIVNADVAAGCALDRSKLAQDALKTYTVPLTEMRVWDAVATILPAAAANDDMGLITGTFGTDVPTLQSIDFKAATTDEKGRFFFALPAEYDAGETITLRLRAGMITTISDGTATVDVECYKSDRDGAAAGAPTDLCATAATTINSLAKANKDFTITPTGLVAGDLLDVRLSFAGTDTATGTAVIGEVSQVEMLLDVKG